MMTTVYVKISVYIKYMQINACYFEKNMSRKKKIKTRHETLCRFKYFEK